MKKSALFVLTFFFGFTCVWAQIIETHHFRDIVSHLTPETLLILDIDDTLLIPVQMLGCDEWFKFRMEKHRVDGLSVSSALEKSLAEWEAIRHLTRMQIVEPSTDRIVASLQELGYCIMGLTTQGVALATRTVQQLKANGIDLSFSAPSKEDHYFPLDGHGMLFRNGVLFTSGKSKGEALFRLLDKIAFSPKKIVFVNDKATHLSDVDEVATTRHVEFVGLRYSYSDARKEAFRPEVAELQFAHSTFTHLLSDEEALSLMEESSGS